MPATDTTTRPHPYCAVGTGAEHPAHAFASDEGTVTCAGWIEP